MGMLKVILTPTIGRKSFKCDSILRLSVDLDFTDSNKIDIIIFSTFKM